MRYHSPQRLGTSDKVSRQQVGHSIKATIISKLTDASAEKGGEIQHNLGVKFEVYSIDSCENVSANCQ